MRFFANTFVLATVGLPLVASLAVYPNLSSRDVVPGQYVVQLRHDTDNSTRAAHHETVRRIRARHMGRRDAFEDTFRNHHQYEIGHFKGYASSLDARMVAELEALPEVVAVHPDIVMYPQKYIEQDYAPWGLCSISTYKQWGTSTYLYDDSAGEDNFAYIVDSGIRLSHHEFEGRAELGFNAVDFSDQDIHGHGTFEAGIVAGKSFGVAKKAKVVAVKVISKDGRAHWTSQLAGLNWAVNDIIAKQRQDMAVILLAIAGPAFETYDEIIQIIESKGIFVVISAGNHNMHANYTSPCRSPGGMCVGAHDPQNWRVPLSNYGPEVDMWAPGVDIQSASNLGDQMAGRGTGTSASAAFVAGLACYFRGLLGPMSAEEVKEKIYSFASGWRLMDGWTSTNLIAYNACGRL